MIGRIYFALIRSVYQTEDSEDEWMYVLRKKEPKADHIRKSDPGKISDMKAARYAACRKAAPAFTSSCEPQENLRRISRLTDFHEFRSRIFQGIDRSGGRQT
jgi:hypothetical protein